MHYLKMPSKSSIFFIEKVQKLIDNILANNRLDSLIWNTSFRIIYKIWVTSGWQGRQTHKRKLERRSWIQLITWKFRSGNTQKNSPFQRIFKSLLNLMTPAIFAGVIDPVGTMACATDMATNWHYSFEKFENQENVAVSPLNFWLMISLLMSS